MLFYSSLFSKFVNNFEISCLADEFIPKVEFTLVMRADTDLENALFWR